VGRKTPVASISRFARSAIRETRETHENCFPFRVFRVKMGTGKKTYFELQKDGLQFIIPSLKGVSDENENFPGHFVFRS